MQSIKLDYSKRCAAEPGTGHNRWHPDIPPALEVDLGEEVELDTRDAFDGQITQESKAEDLLSIDLNLVHPLTGPVFAKGVQAGDLLEVSILEVQPAAWGLHRPSGRQQRRPGLHRDDRPGSQRRDDPGRRRQQRHPDAGESGRRQLAGRQQSARH